MVSVTIKGREVEFIKERMTGKKIDVYWKVFTSIWASVSSKWYKADIPMSELGLLFKVKATWLTVILVCHLV